MQKSSRVVIEEVQPEIDSGRFPVKRTPGEWVRVTAAIHADGHDVLAAVLKVRHEGQLHWQRIVMTSQPNDAWEGSFRVENLGFYVYTLEAWIDRFATWRHFLDIKLSAQQQGESDFLEGAELLEAAAARAAQTHVVFLRQEAAKLRQTKDSTARAQTALSQSLLDTMAAYPDPSDISVYDRQLRVCVERERARYGAWYEMFPRSTGTTTEHSATFLEAEARLGGIAAMGFDVLYLPPIHPIGKSFRKGANNSLRAKPTEPGSPWAIGSAEGGHKAVHPELGTLDDFDRFVAAARRKNLEIALDIAYQCSPDHPYVREHPGWFKHRPGGAIKYAENPPKKYEDIYPLDFECEDREALWNELRDVVLFWIGHGVTIFRVDNPHTKPYRFWEWLIGEIHTKHPDVIFLAEAFTRPHIVAELAKCGFSQSYTYFTWRNTKAELIDYFTDLAQMPIREYFRPNLFVNTPDILHAYLQTGGRPAFMIRLFLAATLGASYGVYGPPFELCVTQAIPETEDYQDSEKYQIRVWDWDQPGNIKSWIKKINAIRRAQSALQFDYPLHFLTVNNDSLLAYTRGSIAQNNLLLIVIALDPRQPQEGWVDFVPEGKSPADPYSVHDLLNDARYTWQGDRHYVRLDPQTCPAHVFSLEPAS